MTAPGVARDAVKWPFQLRDKVRIISDPDRHGAYAGRTGTVASNELDGIIFVHLGMTYANFRTNDLERIREVPPGDFECCRRPRGDREQWKFRGRETHWGYTFLVWTLEANPPARNEIGKRFVRFVK